MEGPAGLPRALRGPAGQDREVGEIKLQTVIGTNLLGMRVQGGGVWHFSNQATRDLPILRQKYPDLAADDVVVDMPRTQEKPTGSVVLSSR